MNTGKTGTISFSPTSSTFFELAARAALREPPRPCIVRPMQQAYEPGVCTNGESGS